MRVATNSTHTTVVHTNSRCGSGHKQYTGIVDMWEWPQTVDTNSRCGSGHKQYTLIVDVGVTHTPTTVVHIYSSHKQYTKC